MSVSLVELGKMNQRKNVFEWQRLVQDCRQSGMTVKAWCARNGISEKSYYYRQKKVWEAAQQQKEEQDAGVSPRPPAIIACAKPLVGIQPEALAALVLRSGSWTLEVNAGCDPKLLRMVLRAVK